MGFESGVNDGGLLVVMVDLLLNMFRKRRVLYLHWTDSTCCTSTEAVL